LCGNLVTLVHFFCPDPSFPAAKAMASTAALIFAILASQVVSGLATSCGAKEEAKLPCLASACSCAELGMENELATKAGAGWQACCKHFTVPTCHGASAANANFCGVGKRFVMPNAPNAAGATAALKITNCCETKPTIACADVDCKAGNTDYLKIKTGVDTTAVADGTCCDGSACTACCEKDATMCYNGASAGKICAADHVFKAFSAADGTITAAGKATFTDDATFKTQCCEAQATCTASPTCAAYQKAKTTMPTGKCAGAVCSGSECCDNKDNICLLASSSCGSDMDLDTTAAMGGSTYAAGATEAVKKSTCCKAKPTVVAATCAKFVDDVAVAKAAAAKKGTTSGAKGAHLAMVVVLGTIAAVSL